MTREDPTVLVELASSGDEVATEALLERHLPLARAVARRRMSRMVRAHYESADIVQSVCRRVLEVEAQGRPQDAEGFKRWLVEIVERRVIDRYRELTSQRRDVGREAAPGGPASAEAPLPDAREGPQSEVERLDEADRVHAAMESMEPEFREALELSAYEGLSYEAVGARMGLTPKQARNRVNRAKLLLGASLRTDD